MSVKLLTEHHSEFLSLKGGCIGSSESTLVKMPHCWNPQVTAQMYITEYPLQPYPFAYKKLLTKGDQDNMTHTVAIDQGLHPGEGGSWVFSIFSYVGLGPAPNIHPKIRNFKHPKKIFEILATPKIPPNLYLYPIKVECIEMAPKYSPICDNPTKISTKSSYPKKYSFF